LEKDFEDDKPSVLDLRVRERAAKLLSGDANDAGRRPAESSRLFLSSIYSGQMREGDSYASLVPAIGICILNQVLCRPQQRFTRDFASAR